MVISWRLYAGVKASLVQLASHSATLTNQALKLAPHWVCLIQTVASPNLGKYDYFLVVKSLAAFAIFGGHCEDSPSALQMLLAEVPECHSLFAAG